MGERFSSGDRRLDAVLGGGLPANALNMILGLPGSGKTILAEQFMFHNASAQRPGMYASTVSEPLEKVLRYGQSLDFFDAQAIGASVFFDDLGHLLDDGGLDDVLAHARTLITERRPGVIVFDSFKALSAYAPNPRALEVLKLRGSGFMSGEHAYRIAHDGLHVFPRAGYLSTVSGTCGAPPWMNCGFASISTRCCSAARTRRSTS
jgi:KaiC